MKITNDSLLHLSDLMAAKAAEHYAVDHNISRTEAARLFIGTDTYGLLCTPESFLALESLEYIMDMLDAEENHDVARWLAI